MNKKWKTTIKIISGFIFFLFVGYILILSSSAQAATSGDISNLYNNPNQNTNNAYKFKISDVVNSNLLTNIVGCTGVVNKVSTWMMKFIQSPIQQAKIAAANVEKARELLKNGCKSTKAATESAAGATPTVNDLVSTVKTIFEKVHIKLGNNMEEKPCLEEVSSINNKELEELIKQTEQETEKKLKEQCFDGIAITLARNQLTSMTRSAMNWVNSGYGGNSFFVKNMINFANNVEKNVLETGIDILLSPNGNQNPYAKNFTESVVTSNNLLSSSTNFFDSLTSDLGSFLLDKNSYYTNDQLDQAENTKTALQRAQEANDAFKNDFSLGGWDGYLALTQRDQNNPLGFTMQANQYLEDQKTKAVSSAKEEVSQNNGFLSQKECTLWQNYNDEDKPITKDKNLFSEIQVGGITTDAVSTKEFSYTATQKNKNDKCRNWKITTPGSLIKEKTTNYLNSPERQLELAKTINDSLNALFSILISKLEQGGLSGLSDSVDNTSNWIDNTNDYVSSDGNTPYNNSGAYDDFNLTRDLGNTYIYEGVKKLGTWNASKNEAANTEYPKLPEPMTMVKLYPNIAPENYKEADSKLELVYPTNGYYKVTTAGKTKLMSYGYNNWEVGDRAFWNGSEWQNWKCKEIDGKCTNQMNPIKKRGVVQIQNDYIVAAKEVLGKLDQIMPKLGELDYCLPGPNPSYQINSSDAQSAYQDWVDSTYSGIYDVSGKRYGVKIDQKNGDRTYDNLKNIYKDNPNIWTKMLGGSKFMLDIDKFDPISYPKYLLKEMSNLIYEFSNICNTSGDCKGAYSYFGSTLNEEEGKIVADKQTIKENVSKYVNNNMFKNFYDTFDKVMNDKYFKNMKNFYNDTEESIGKVTNDAYIPMAEGGFDLTKDILYYNDDVTKAKSDYNDAMNQARVNISKLEPIKSEVSGIIMAAQDRRNKELVDKLGLSLSQIKTKYATCFNEENIEFYDADNITAMGNTDSENCFDGIDNDLNGLIDKEDSVCAAYYGYNPKNGDDPTGSCVIDQTSGIDAAKTTSGILMLPKAETGQDLCTTNYKKESCNLYQEYYQTGTKNMIYRCKWTNN